MTLSVQLLYSVPCRLIIIAYGEGQGEEEASRLSLAKEAFPNRTGMILAPLRDCAPAQSHNASNQTARNLLTFTVLPPWHICLLHWLR
jgi:hypothetical protein